MLLADGTPVWEVRDSGGRVWILGAAVTPTAEAVRNALLGPLPGVETLSTWMKPDHQFNAGGAVYDSHGTALGYAAPFVGGNPPLPTTARDMTTYDVTVTPTGVIVGPARPGETRRFDPHHAISTRGVYQMDQVISFDPPTGSSIPVRTISQALAEPPGTMNLVDADIVVVGDGPARICSGGHRTDHVPFPPCTATSPTLGTVSDPANARYVSAVTGPVFLRTGGPSFSEVAVEGNGGVGVGYAIAGPLPAPAA